MIDKYEELVSLVEEALEVAPGTIAQGEESDWSEKWDSLGHLSILMKLDLHLDGRCSEIVELSTAYRIDEIASILRKEGLMN